MPSWQRIARRIRVPAGFVFAALYVWLAHPTWLSLLIGSLLSIFGVVVRALASGHVRKNEELTTTGPYAYTRNPLYLGSLIIAIGFTLASRSWIIAAIAAAIYVPVIRSEEKFLRARFPQFEEYCREVPRLFPRRRPAAASAGEFSSDLFWKHREYKAALGTAALIAVLAVKLLWLR
jgi:protein-S-isoprenylcysteine O-methyltransferase Ste14